MMNQYAGTQGVLSFGLKRVKKNARQRKEESSRSQVQCVRRISPPVALLSTTGTWNIQVPKAVRREQEGE